MNKKVRKMLGNILIQRKRRLHSWNRLINMAPSISIVKEELKQLLALDWQNAEPTEPLVLRTIDKVEECHHRRDQIMGMSD